MINQSNSIPGSVNRGPEKKYNGNYLGIVIQNNDPEQRGRVKIYIPHINPSVYLNWDRVIKDKKFKFPGSNIESDLSIIIDELKQVLPWAECAAPLVGATGSATYNAFEDHATISDSSKRVGRFPSDVETKYQLNTENIGEKPARLYEGEDVKLSDAYDGSDGSVGKPRHINKLYSNYKPSSYSNSSKGSFSIPNVGSHVWVFHNNGNLTSPVYFATSFGKTDWSQINDNIDGTGSLDYPSTYENVSKSDDATYNHNTETYRNKFVLNQKGGTLEVVNTDNKEILKLTHYSGSFKEFNNESTIELATANDQKLVLGDVFHTARGHYNDYIERDFEHIIRGDAYRKIGTFNTEAFNEWEDKVTSLANLKQLFEIKRTGYIENPVIQKTSPGEPGESGQRAPCPLCSTGESKFWDVNNIGPAAISPCISFMGATSMFSFLGALLGLSNFNWSGGGSPGNFLGGGACPVCGGTGKSPSTQDGEFASNKKDTLIKSKIRDLVSDLSLIEKNLGEGGSEIINITKHKVETIGLGFNSFPSIRVDNVGKISHSKVSIFPKGVVTSFDTSPLIEYTHVDDMPGGTYSLNVCNRFNVQVGAGGISLKTYGPVDISGSITNIAGEQVNIASENEVNIAAGKRINIKAEILTLRQSQGKQVLVDSNLGVSQNVIVGGGMHVEGELTVQHITGPLEVQETHFTKCYGQLVAGTKIGNAIGHGDDGRPVNIPVFAVATPMSLYTYDHSHLYNNVAMTYANDSNSVRKAAKILEEGAKVPPIPASSGPKGSGLFDVGEIL